MRRSAGRDEEGSALTNRKYRVLVGCQYPPNDGLRREPGEIVSDIPSWLGDVLEADGTVERVAEAPDHEVAEPEAPTAVTETPEGDIVVAHVDHHGKPEIDEASPAQQAEVD